MINKKHSLMSKSNLLMITFVFIEAILYASFLYFDFADTRAAEYIKYTSILLCFVASIVLIIKKRTICSVFTALAILFTCISDYFLLLSHKADLFYVGVFTFFITQVFYALVINKHAKKKRLPLDIGLRVALTFIVVVVLASIKMDALTICALIYFIELLVNFIMSLVHSKENKRFLILAVAFLLFMLCDINVALNNFNIENESLRFAIYFMMWLFYSPSQVILSTNSYFLE